MRRQMERHDISPVDSDASTDDQDADDGTSIRKNPFQSFGLKGNDNSEVFSVSKNCKVSLNRIGMTEEQRLEEGKRMFQMFAAKMFEQRVLTAYREKVNFIASKAEFQRFFRPKNFKFEEKVWISKFQTFIVTFQC